MPIAKRPDRGVYEVTVCHHGKVYRKSSRHWDRAKALEVERKLVDDLHTLDMGRQPARSFYDAVEKWTTEELPRYRDQDREKACMSQLAPFIEGKQLADYQTAHDEALAAWKGLAPGTVNRRLALLRRLLNLAWKQWGWLDQPVAQRIRLLPDRGGRHVYMTQAQVEDLASRCPRSGGYVLLAAYTGIRLGQLLRLTRADVVGGCLNLGTDGKTGQPQLLPLHKRVRAAALRLPLCSRQVLRDEWEAARKKAELGHVRFHDLRHTAASWLMHAGGDLMVVRDFLGHSDVRVTQRYAHLKTEHIAKFLHQIPTKRKRKVA